jgi:NADH-quinone oxidoreductase subunit H
VWSALPAYAQSTAWILLITVSLIISVALLTLWERKVIGWIQLRRGPNRVRIFGLCRVSGSPLPMW